MPGANQLQILINSLKPLNPLRGTLILMILRKLALVIIKMASKIPNITLKLMGFLSPD